MQTPVKEPMLSSDMAVTVFISSNDLLKDKRHHRAVQNYIKNTENRHRHHRTSLQSHKNNATAKPQRNAEGKKSSYSKLPYFSAGSNPSDHAGNDSVKPDTHANKMDQCIYPVSESGQKKIMNPYKQQIYRNTRNDVQHRQLLVTYFK